MPPKLRPEEFGVITNSMKDKQRGINPKDITKHVYILAATGNGKTALLMNLILQFTHASLKGIFPCSVIYMDMKGSGDSHKIIKQLPRQIHDEGKSHLLDPNLIEFSVNPLELPSYDKSNPLTREKLVSRFVGFMMKMFASWYGDQSSFVRLERILFTMVHYLYLNTDSPTFADLHDLILRFQAEGSDAVAEVFRALGKPHEEMENAIRSIADLKGDSFDPILNRIEKFQADVLLRKMFNARHSTVDFQKLIEDGNVSVVNINEATTSFGIDRLALMSFLLKLYFTLQLRSIDVPEKDRTPVILILDEFQVVEGLQLIPQMLAQARSLGLGVVLSHQNLSQVNPELRGTILGNVATSFIGRIAGQDAQILGQAWDPQFKNDITNMLPAQAPFEWRWRVNPGSGQPQPTLQQMWSRPPPDEIMSDAEFVSYIEEQRKRYSVGVVEKPLMIQKNAERFEWMRQLGDLQPPEELSWRLLSTLYLKPNSGVMDIERSTGTPRKDFKQTLEQLVSDKLVIGSEPKEIGAQVSIDYSLSDLARTKYFTFNYKEIGKAEDIPEVSKKAIEYYLQKGYFVTIANQELRKGKLRVDIIAYSYKSQQPISVEIESMVEIQSHPAQVKFNFEKASELGFGEIHSWSKSENNLKTIYDSLDEETKQKSKIFIVHSDGTIKNYP